jgi:hypothetical protein
MSIVYYLQFTNKEKANHTSIFHPPPLTLEKPSICIFKIFFFEIQRYGEDCLINLTHLL